MIRKVSDRDKYDPRMGSAISSGSLKQCHHRSDHARRPLGLAELRHVRFFVYPQMRSINYNTISSIVSLTERLRLGRRTPNFGQSEFEKSDKLTPEALK